MSLFSSILLDTLVVGFFWYGSCPGVFFFFFFNIYIWLCWVLVLAFGIFSCCMRNVVPWPGIEPRPPALGAQSLTHLTIREVPFLEFWKMSLIICVISSYLSFFSSWVGTPVIWILDILDRSSKFSLLI